MKRKARKVVKRNTSSKNLQCKVADTALKLERDAVARCYTIMSTIIGGVVVQIETVQIETIILNGNRNSFCPDVAHVYYGVPGCLDFEMAGLIVQRVFLQQ